MAGRPSDKQKELEAKKLLEELGYELIPNGYFKCSMSGNLLSLKQQHFYQTSNPLYAGCIGEVDGNKINILPFSKKSIGSLYKEFCIKTKNNKKFAMYKLCQELRLPWIENLWESAEKSKTESYRFYIGKLNSLPQYSDRCSDNEDDYIGSEDEMTDVTIKHKKISITKQEDLVNKWGNYDLEILRRFEEKYEFLKNNYNEQTNMHTEALLKYVRYAVLEQIANETGDTATAKTYNGLANSAATAAKINPSQLSKADLSDGLNSFSELSLAIEEAVDIIKILPKFKFRPNDALDFNIWCYVNYERNLNGLPEVAYEDIYKFYDERVEEYVKQYGDPYHLFENDPMIENRPKIEKFIKPIISEEE